MVFALGIFYNNSPEISNIGGVGFLDGGFVTEPFDRGSGSGIRPAFWISK